MKYVRSNAKAKTEEEWEKSFEKQPLSKFWHLILNLQLLLLESVKSLRSGNFMCCVETIKQITPWMFSLDYHNYTRELPVHLTQIIDLKHCENYCGFI